jgi:hypothetical protein
MFWPPELLEEAGKLSVIPGLLRTQDEFISILSVPVPNADSLFQIVNTSSFPGNMFLKHLALLADFGGEQLQRINSNFEMLFPNGRMEYLWNSEFHTYTFQELPLVRLSNDHLSISSDRLFEPRKLDGLLQDVAAILIFGSACTDETTAEILQKCEICDYLGKPAELATFIKQRYIWVSRITMGSQTNCWVSWPSNLSWTT